MRRKNPCDDAFARYLRLDPAKSKDQIEKTYRHYSNVLNRVMNPRRLMVVLLVIVGALLAENVEVILAPILFAATYTMWARQ